MDEHTLGELKEFFGKIKTNKNAFPFKQDIEEVIKSFPNYTDYISKPIDLNKIENRILTRRYANIEQFKDDFDLMIDNCVKFNTNPDHWVRRSCHGLKEFFDANYKKLAQKITKYYEKLSAQSIKQKQQIAASSNNVISSNYYDYDSMSNHNLNNIQVVSTTESDKITKKIRSIFAKISHSLKLDEQKTIELINTIVKVIVKRTKTLDQVYEDTMKFVSKNIGSDLEKAYFSKKFRKLLKAIKEEQQENQKTENKTFNIKINLSEGVEQNEEVEQKEEQMKIERIRKEVFNFMENQKIPEIFREISDYPIEPNLRKKILAHVTEIRNKYTN